MLIESMPDSLARRNDNGIKKKPRKAIRFGWDVSFQTHTKSNRLIFVLSVPILSCSLLVSSSPHSPRYLFPPPHLLRVGGYIGIILTVCHPDRVPDFVRTISLEPLNHF